MSAGEVIGGMAKALVGAAAAGVAAVAVAAVDEQITMGEWWAAGAAAVAVLSAVYYVPNRKPVDPDVGPLGPVYEGEHRA